MFCCCDGSHSDREALVSPLGKQPYVEPWHSKHETPHRWHAHRGLRRAPADCRPPEVVVASSLPDQCRLPVVNRRGQLVVAVNRQGWAILRVLASLFPRPIQGCCSWGNAYSTDANANDPTGKVIAREPWETRVAQSYSQTWKVPCRLRLAHLDHPSSAMFSRRNAGKHSCDDPRRF
jgi:hypothetical protein